MFLFRGLFQVVSILLMKRDGEIHFQAYKIPKGFYEVDL
jgi:hypothetical protein